MSKLIATRISLQLPPAPPSEPTDTLVLTFRTHYIDLRIHRASLSTIDSGFAGTLSHASPTHTRWAHIVDAHPAPPGEVDEGEFTLLPNGDEVEEGTTGPDAQPYREVWRQVPVERGAAAYFLESVGGRRKVFAGRIGLYYLCMGQTGPGEGYGAVRWQMERGTWRLVYEVGEAGALPGPREVGEVREGERVRIGGVGYVVREAYTV